MPEPINLMQDPEPTSIKMQRIMQDEERKRALAAGKDPNAGALFKNDFATPQLIELGRRYPQLLDPMAQAQVPDNIRVQAAELMALREAQERIQFQNLVASNVMMGTKPVEEPTYLARPGEAPSDAGAVRWRKIAEERAFRSQMASQVGESVMGMASAMAGAPSRMPRLQTAPTMMGVQKGQPMPPSDWNRPGSQMGAWWESLPTAAQQGMNVAGRQAKAEGRVPMVTPEGPISLTLPTPTRTTPKPTTTIEVADRTMPTVVRPTLPEVNRSTGITYWDPYNPTAFTQQLLRQDREKSGQSKGLSLATICSGIGATATAAPEIFRSVLAVDIDMRKAETAEKIGNKTTVQSLLDMSPDQLVDPQTNESVRVVQASLPCRSSSKANWQRTTSSPKDTEMASKFVELVSSRVNSDGGPSVVMLENVPEYERSDAANVLRTQLKNLGYNWHEQVYNASEHGSLQARRRWWGFAYKDGVEFTPPQKQQSRPWIEAISDGVSRMPIEKDPRSIRSVITKGAEALRARGHDPKTYDNWVLLDGAHYNHQPNIRLANEPAMTIKAKENEIVRIWNPATNEIRRADGRFMARLFDVPDEISSKLADSPYGHIKTGFGDSIPFKMVQAVVGSLKLPDQFPSRTVSQPITNTPSPTQSIKPNKVSIELVERKLDSDGYIRNVYSLPSGEKLIWRGREENIEIPKSGVTVNVGSKPNWIPIEERKVSDGPDTTYSASKTLTGVLQVASMVSGHKNKDVSKMLSMVRRGEYDEKMYEIIDGLIALNLLDSSGRRRESIENPSFHKYIDQNLVNKDATPRNERNVLIGGQDAESIMVRALNGDVDAQVEVAKSRSALKYLLTEDDPRIPFTAEELKNELPLDDLVAVHATSYLPELTSSGTAKIKSRSAAMDYGFPRNTVHTSLNHIVESHSAGSWSDRDYVVLTPLKNIVEGPNKVPTMLNTVDTWWSLNPGESLEMPNAILIAPGSKTQTDPVVRKNNVYYYPPGKSGEEKEKNRKEAFQKAMEDLDKYIAPGGMWAWGDSHNVTAKTHRLAAKLGTESGHHSNSKHHHVQEALMSQMWNDDYDFDLEKGRNTKKKWKSYQHWESAPSDPYSKEGRKAIYFNTRDLMSDLPHLRNLYEHGFFTGRGTHLDVLRRQGMFDLHLEDEIDPKYQAARSKVMQMIRQNDYLQRPKPKQISMTKKPKN